VNLYTYYRVIFIKRKIDPQSLMILNFKIIFREVEIIRNWIFSSIIYKERHPEMKTKIIELKSNLILNEIFFNLTMHY